MMKSSCIHPQLNWVLANTGHTDRLLVVDAGFPIPEEVQRVDLAWTRGKPGFIEVCRLLKEQLAVEKIYLALEIEEASQGLWQEFLHLFEGYAIEYISHEELKQKAGGARGVVRTGECTPFANCVFVAGVDFGAAAPAG